MSGFAAALAALPTGTFTGTADGRRYVVTKIAFARNRAIKLVAEERGGSDYISLNWYALTSGGLLRPWARGGSVFVNAGLWQKHLRG